MSDLSLQTMWDKSEAIAEIKKIYAPTLSEGEFRTFVEIGKASDLNPFKKEIWAVKFGNTPAQIFVGRDGYRVAIGRNPNYESHTVDAVYENDNFEIDAMNNKYLHKYNLCNRGKLIGAYCLVFMKSSNRPYYVFCSFDEYNLGQSLWKSKPATMIKKVAEAQCIRMALPNMLNGTYSDDELPEVKSKTVTYNNSDYIYTTIDIPTYEKNILESDTLEKLTIIANDLKIVDISPEDKKYLSSIYKNKLNELRNINDNKPDK